MNFSHTSFWGLWAGDLLPSLSSHKAGTDAYAKLTSDCTAGHKWHEFGDFSTVPSFAKTIAWFGTMHGK